MKLTEAKLKKVIEEEVEAMVKEGELDEGWLDRLRARMSGAGEKIKGKSTAAAQKAAGKLAGYVPGKAAKKFSKEAGIEAAATAAASKERVKARKIEKLLSLHLKTLENDLAKLKLDDDLAVKSAVGQLKFAISAAVLRSA